MNNKVFQVYMYGKYIGIYMTIKINRNSVFIISEKNDIIIISFKNDTIKQTEDNIIINDNIILKVLSSIQQSGMITLNNKIKNPDINSIRNDYVNDFISGWKLSILFTHYNIKIPNNLRLWIIECIVKANIILYIFNGTKSNTIEIYKEKLNKHIKEDICQ